MKVIFLDIDGVLVNRQSLIQASGLRATAWPSCVEALNRIIQATDAQIVISSTWRYMCRAMGFETPNAFMREKLNEWGVKGIVLGCTPDLSRESHKVSGVYIGAERGDEIQAWLGRAREPVESFVILDDDSDMKHLTPFLVRTNHEIGLTDDDIEKATTILNVGRPTSVTDTTR